MLTLTEQHGLLNMMQSLRGYENSECKQQLISILETTTSLDNYLGLRFICEVIRRMNLYEETSWNAGVQLEPVQILRLSRRNIDKIKLNCLDPSNVKFTQNVYFTCI